MRDETPYSSRVSADGERETFRSRLGFPPGTSRALGCRRAPHGIDLESACFVRRLLEERELAMEERAQLGVDLAGFREAFPEPDGFIL